MVFDGGQTSRSGIVSRILRAAGAQGVNQLARVVQLFLLVPICLEGWGTAVYEDWLLLNSIAAFLVLADFGLVQSTTVRLLDAWSKDERERFAREWELAIGIFAVLVTVLTGLLGLAWVRSNWAVFIPARQLPHDDLAAIAVQLAFMQLATILIGLGLAAYRARGDLSRSYHVSSILIGMQTAAVAGSVAAGYGPVTAAAAVAGCTAVTLVGVAADLALRYPDFRWRPIVPSFAQFSARLREALGYLVAPVSTTIMVNGPNLILGATGAPEGAIALFTATRTIAGVARQLPYQFAHPAGVELAALLGRRDQARLTRLYVHASRALAVIVGALGGATIAAAPLVMTLWTHGKIAYDPWLMLLMVGTTAVCAPSQVAYTLLWYGGFPGLLSKALVFWTVLAMGMSSMLAPRLEARGVAAGLGIGEIVGIAVYLVILVDRLLDRKAGVDLLANFLITVLSFIGSAAIAYAINYLLNPRNWGGLVELGILWTLSAAAGGYWLVLSGRQREQMNATLSRVLRSMRRTTRMHLG